MRYDRYLLLCLLASTAVACAGEARDSVRQQATAHYLANEGVMVVRGETKILFDPLFQNSYGQYQLPPAQIREALLAGTPPYNDIDMVFISHFHGDHFSPADILSLMKSQLGVRLAAPAQAVSALTALSDVTEDVRQRITAVSLEYGDAPVSHSIGGIQIDAVRIPHAGWPTGRLDVENIAWRVTLDNDVTVLHLGDADPRDLHFAQDADYWAARQINMAFPPYWYFLADGGREVLNNRLQPYHSVGTHVPEAMPDTPANRPAEYQGYDLFTEPGETRLIPSVRAGND
ncbi:MAG: MBL fold metallo-hydrolase [Aquisalinus sp.]|nr:MBL fold metallo-hydrolase [Aquisalinus sp.]